MQEMQFRRGLDPWVGSLGWEDSLEEGQQPTSVFLPGESHGQRSLAGYSPWGHKESYTTELYRTDEPCSELDIFKLLYSLFWDIDELPLNSLISPALVFF